MNRRQLEDQLRELRYERNRKVARGFSTRSIDTELARIEQELKALHAFS